MIEFNLLSQQGPAAPAVLPISVIGIGGAGANVLDTIALEGLPDARLVAMNTDARALQNSMTGTKLQLGRDLTQGLGAGGDPEVGAEAAQISESDVRAEVQGQRMVFLCVGLGGGTGSGAAPLVARVAREEGAFVVVFAMMPFTFEGRRRVRQAVDALQALRRHASALVTFDNDRIGELVLPKKGIQDAFAAADKVVSQSIRAIINLVSQPGLIRIGMDDLITALRNHDSRCLFGYGIGKGETRASDALRQALKSPLFDSEHLHRFARNVLVHVCGGPDMTFFEVQELMNNFSSHLHEDAQLLFGTGTDPRLTDQVSITILTSWGKEAESGDDLSAAFVPATSIPIPLVNRREQAVAAPLPPTVQEPIHDLPAALENVEVESVGTSDNDLIVAIGDCATEAADDVAVADDAATSEIASNAGAYADIIAGATDAEDGVTCDALAETNIAGDEAEVIDEIQEPQSSEIAGIESREAVTTADSGISDPIDERIDEPAAASSDVHLRDLAAPRGRPSASEKRPSLSPKPLPFQSWRREQARLSSLPPQPPEKVAPVSDLDDLSNHEATPSPPISRGQKPGPRLPLFLNRHRKAVEPATPAFSPQQQATFDESLHPGSRGRFDKAQPTIEDGENLDVPTFMRRKGK